MSIRRLLAVLPTLFAAFLLMVSGRAHATNVNIVGTAITGPSNCIPFGGYSNAYMGFVYKNIPAFTLGAGDTISFDLAAMNDVNIVMDIALATTTSNGSMQENSSGFTTVLSSGTPSSPKGDTTSGNYELTYTVTGSFVFGGGGLIIRFKPIGTMATDSNCTQVLMHADATDSSGLFTGRFYTDPDGVYPWSGTDTVHIGVVKIVTGSIPYYRDSDGDGYGDASVVTYASSAPSGYVSNSTDCNDASASIHPGATETCNSIDDDCDSVIDEGAGTAWYADADGDAYGNATTVTVSCTSPSGYVSNSTDCNDANSAVHPFATEYCNSIDDDCDSSIDEGAVDATTYYADADGDTYGNASSSSASCSLPSGYVTNSSDCNDSNSAVHPLATEYCNGIDDDCNSVVDDTTAVDAGTWYADADSDTYGNASWSTRACTAPSRYVADATDCNDSNSAVHPGATEYCNGIDDDCNSIIDDSTAADASTWYADADSDAYGNASVSLAACSAPSGYIANNTDCDDSRAATHPGATEYCNDIDDDCDSSIDEGAVDAATWYADADTDAFGDVSVSTVICDQPSGYVADASDCDDGNYDVNPAATEVCNGIDDDCDGTIDLGASDPSTWYADSDSDGYGDLSMGTEECTAPSGYIADSTDCDDSNAAVFPGATEVCNGIDDDCNSVVDDGATDAVNWYADADSDSFGNASVFVAECSPPAGYVGDTTDCDDTNAAVFPGATEVCNGIDDDCNTLIDDSAIDASTWYADADEDTFGDSTTWLDSCTAPSGYLADDTDCDDTNADVFPGADEVCNSIDDDCNSIVDDGALDALTWYADADGDTFGDNAATIAECTAPAGYIVDNTDCDDTNAAVFPGAEEVCNGIDDDCDTLIDNGATDSAVWYADADGDTFGDVTAAIAECTPPLGYLADATDCDDTNAAVFPGADEVCNDIDDNCDSLVDNAAIDAVPWYADADSDTYGDPAVTVDACTAPDGFLDDDSDCDDTDATVYPGATEIPYDGIDQDCSGDDVIDADGDGYIADVAGGDDCDDTDATVFPGSPESADGIDSNCDGIVDENTVWYDDDADGYTEDGGDCDDADATSNPAGSETEDGTDEDCNGIVDDTTDAYDDDGDGVTENDGDCNDGDDRQSPDNTEVSGDGIDNDCDGAVDDGVNDPDVDGYTELGGDCDPADGTVHPGAEEVADGKDNDCDGEIDEGTNAVDGDGDGATPAQGDCDDTDSTIGVDAVEVEDGVDNDCDGDVDEGTNVFDDDGDGYTEEGGDCDDADAAVSPSSEEVVNGIDDNCDGVVDAGVMDLDADGYTVEAGDCDDTNGWANPGLAEMCDGIDNNCDGETDEDCTEADDVFGKTGGCGCTTNGSTGGGLMVSIGAAMVAMVGLRRRGTAKPLSSASSLPFSLREKVPAYSRADEGRRTALLATLFPMLAALVGCGQDVGITKSAKQLVVSPGLVDLGDVAVGTTTTFDITLETTSGSEVNIIAVDVLAIAGGGFEQADQELPTVLFQETGTLSFTYTADAEGWNQAQITIQTDEETDNAHVVDARAHAAVPGAELWPRMLDFGPVSPGSSGIGQYTLMNTGAIAIDVGSLTFDNPVYSASLALPAAVGAGESLAINVVFEPTDTTPALGTLTVGLVDGSTVPFSGMRGNDCIDGSADLYDADGDGYSGCATDCDDGNPDVHPGAGETCDTLDQDCDGFVDEGTSCADDDDDGYTEDGGDCNDADPDVNPGVDEVQGNGKDDNCDGLLDQGSVDNDGDGTSTDGGDCDDADGTVFIGAPELEDGIDNDCDGSVDEGTDSVDDDGDGYSEDAGDCDDGSTSIFPSAPELADWQDNDCNGLVDEGTVNSDDDSDGYTEVGGDCDDGDSTVSPGEWDVADGVDNDCNGVIDG